MPSRCLLSIKKRNFSIVNLCGTDLRDFNNEQGFFFVNQAMIQYLV